MKRFEHFADYMFALLFGPLKKAQKAANQYFLFFEVIGKLFDELKEDIFRIRDEANIATASTTMLPIHGEDREKIRFEGEPWELYRKRLMMHGIVAAQAGTTAGIISLVKSMGYQNVHLEPLFLTDPTRWAEATLWISGGNIVIDDRTAILSEVNRIKPGTALIGLAQEQIYDASIYMAVDTEIYKIMDIGQVG